MCHPGPLGLASCLHTPPTPPPNSLKILYTRQDHEPATTALLHHPAEVVLSPHKAALVPSAVHKKQNLKAIFGLVDTGCTSTLGSHLFEGECG